MMKKAPLICLLLMAATTLTLHTALGAQEDEEIAPQPAWVDLSAKERREVLAFAEDYKEFMRHAKTELSFVTEAVGIARKAGFREL